MNNEKFSYSKSLQLSNWDMFGNGSILEHKSHTKGELKFNDKEKERLYEGIKQSLEQAYRSVSSLLSPEEKPKWNSYFSDIKSYDDAWDVISMANALVYEDWQMNITKIKQYQSREHYAFICHSAQWAYNYQENRDSYVSCSLCTEENSHFFNRPFGFIYSPRLIVAADPEDLGTFNQAESLSEMIAYSIPVIRTFQEIIDNTGNEEFSYNEIVISNDEAPEAIFYMEGKDQYGNNNIEGAKELARLNQDLPIIMLWQKC